MHVFFFRFSAILPASGSSGTYLRGYKYNVMNKRQKQELARIEKQIIEVAHNVGRRRSFILWEREWI